MTLASMMLLVAAGQAPEWRGFRLPASATVVSERANERIDGRPGLGLHRAYLQIENSVLMNDFHPDIGTALATSWEECDVALGTALSNASRMTKLRFHERAWIDRKHERIVHIMTFDKMVDDPEIESAFNATISYSEDKMTFELLARGICDPLHASKIAPRQSLYESSGYCSEAQIGERFTPEVWEIGDPKTRGLMVADLLCRGLVLGLDREEVDLLLGPADIDHGGSMVAYRIYTEQPLWWSRVPPPDGLGLIENTYLLSIGVSDDDDYGRTVQLIEEREN